jgi:hypothetical protein
MHTFNVQLTKQQTKAIQKEWDEHGTDGALILAQTAINFGPFQAKHGLLMCVIITPSQREKIQAILKS